MYQPESPALEPESSVLELPAARALTHTAVNSGVALPAQLQEFLGKILKYKSGINLYMNEFRGAKAGGSALPKLHQLFLLLVKIEAGIKESGDQKAIKQVFKKSVAEKELSEVWDSYREWQKTKDQKAEEEKIRLERARIAQWAVQEAKDLCKQLSTGPSEKNGLGTVIAGLVHVTDKAVWVGTSGFSHHKQASHPVMTTLLQGTHKAQDWPVEACAEVDVLKQYLTEYDIKDASRIDGANLYFHAEGWSLINSKDPNGGYKWKPWAACKNCSQWFGKINAQRI